MIVDGTDHLDTSPEIDGNQYNHHCVMTAGGRDWLIHRILDHGRVIELVRPHAGCLLGTMLDVSKVDWESYCAKAVAHGDGDDGVLVDVVCRPEAAEGLAVSWRVDRQGR